MKKTLIETAPPERPHPLGALAYDPLTDDHWGALEDWLEHLATGYTAVDGDDDARRALYYLRRVKHWRKRGNP